MLHGRLQKRPKPSGKYRVLETGLSPSILDHFSHRGRQGTEGGHREGVGLCSGLSELRSIHDSIYNMNMKFVGLDFISLYMSRMHVLGDPGCARACMANDHVINFRNTCSNNEDLGLGTKFKFSI